MRDDIFYFGCRESLGHYLRDVRGIIMNRNDVPIDFPVNPMGLDGTLLPPRQVQVEFKGILVHIGGWTIWAFWDRTVDKRIGSNSAFIARGKLTIEQIMNRATGAFPSICKRFPFDKFQISE